MIYEYIFPDKESVIRQRLDALAIGKVDPHPGSTNSEAMEEILAALSKGQRFPYKSQYQRKKVDIKDWPINTRLAKAIQEIFALRKIDH